MKNLKTTILTALIAFCCYTNVNAQATEGKTKGKVAMPGRPGTFAVLGGGLLTPSSDAKDNANVVNSATLNADVFLPLLRKEGSNFNFGVNLGGSYSFGGSGNPSTPLPAAYAVTGATSSSVAYKRGGDPAQAGFLTGIGPQANFYFGKLIVSPMVLGEYFSMTQKELSAVQTTESNGQSYDFNLATMPETKTSGFAVTPKVRIHYMINEHFGFFADAGYTMGPKAEIATSKLIPNGAPNQGGSYTVQQLQTGTMTKGETKSTALNSVGFNFGVVIGVDKAKYRDDTHKGWNGKGKANTDDIKKGWNGKTNTSSTNSIETEVPKTNSNNTQVASIAIKSNGKTLDKITPIIDGSTVEGKIKMALGKSNSNLTVKLKQNKTGETVSSITDGNGNFLISSVPDSISMISVNDVEFGKIKILNSPLTDDKNTKASIDDIKKSWNGKTVDMIVPKIATTGTKVDNISIKGSGEFTKNGVPIVYGKIVNGTIKMGKGISNSGIEIVIEQKESNDFSKAITDDKGNFIVKVAIDTVHIVSVNNVEYGKIKILSNPSNDNEATNAYTDDIKKGWNGITLMSPKNNEKLSSEETKDGVSFRWTPVVPKPKDPVTYRLKVWQLIEGQTAEQAMRDNQPETIDVNNETQTKTKYTGPCKPPFICKWVWNVQALDVEGKTIGENQGTSELSSFTR